MDLRAPLSPSHGMRLLADFLRETRSRLTPAEAANEAIIDWIARKRGQLPNVIVGPSSVTDACDGTGDRASRGNAPGGSRGGGSVPNGYRWKYTFLPDGTRLRMQWSGSSHDAVIQGGKLLYDGRAMSPRQMTIAVAGKGYNAWRTLWLLLPGATRWKLAWEVRNEANQPRGPRPVSPQEAMAAAAQSMHETLRSALALVDHATGRALPQVERRLERKRRESDYLADVCMKD